MTDVTCECDLSYTFQLEFGLDVGSHTLGLNYICLHRYLISLYSATEK